MTKKILAVGLLISILMLTSCYRKIEPRPVETVQEIIKGESVDLASYLGTDYTASMKRFENMERESGSDQYTNHKFKVTVYDKKINEIELIGSSDYNLYGIYYEMPASEAMSIMKKICIKVDTEDLDANGDISVSGEISRGEETLYLHYDTKNNGNYVDKVYLS